MSCSRFLDDVSLDCKNYFNAALAENYSLSKSKNAVQNPIASLKGLVAYLRTNKWNFVSGAATFLQSNMWTLLSSLVFAILVCQQFCGGITFTCVGVYSAMCPVARYVCWGHMMKLIFAFFFYKLVTTNSVFTAAANSSAATLVLIFAAIVGLVRRCFQIVMRIFRYISSAYVSSIFRVAGNSDFVWEKFIPSVYGRLISSSTHLSFSSKKELYRCLCESILIDNGRKIFKIEKLTRKITYVLSARDRSITWGDQRHYWSWSHRSDSKSTLKNFKLYYKDPTYNGQVRNHRKNPNRSFIAEHELRSLSDYESEEHMD